MAEVNVTRTDSTIEIVRITAVGPQGIQGESGTSGISGTSGTSGVNGTSGINGTSGLDGTNGVNGTSGLDGTNGVNGTSGIDGTSGVDGTSGIDGTSGVDGTSGIDGTSGFSIDSGSFATTGSNTFVGNQIISGSLFTTSPNITMGTLAGANNQNTNAIAIGNSAGKSYQGIAAVSIGDNAGFTSQSAAAIAIGSTAGFENQGIFAVGIGSQAGYINQGTQSVALGAGAGSSNQGNGATAIGSNAGSVNQGQRAVAIGSLAGSQTQGEYAIAIGNFAAPNNQGANSIVISATGTGLENTTPNSLVIAPIRNVNGNDGLLQYNNTTKEVSYSNQFTGSLVVTGSFEVVGSVTASKVLTDLVRFNTSAGVSVGVGQLAWNNSDGTLDLGMKGGNVVQQIGQEIFYEVRNDTGIQIPNGTAVFASGVTAGSGRITAAPYTADGSVREVRFLGLATENISTGINGFVTHFGYVRGLDTRGDVVSSIAVGDETWAVGDILYVHPTVAGKLTNVKPEHAITVAIIITRHQSVGVLFVRPSSGGHLEDIHDILINTGSLTNGQVLSYNSTSGLWENTNQINTSSFATTGSNTFVGNQIVSGTLNIATNSGDEGGEIQLGKAVTNTTIAGNNVVVDVFRDRVRIFEDGGSSRGAFLNVVSQSAGVGSEIVTSPNIFSIQTISSASYAALTPPVSGTLYIII